MVLKKVEESKETKEAKETKDTKKKEIIQVVAQLPTQTIRRLEREDSIVNFITVEECLTSLVNSGKTKE